ncbi:dephospho-CoA kinase [Pseudaeromonas paramecii]|uniref:Dephospho-CoA kinase n=1 Tax=Pseudaeromonas paramecii TaxID=2138166 RepID=A0ABP8QES1_9GAMM
MIKPAPYIVGLTGGIASGKSTVARVFAAQGIAVVDADDISRQVVAPGSSGLQGILEHFGQQMLTADGQLDRRRLRELIFSQPDERIWLEQWLHPRIETAMQEACLLATSPYVILMVPLLLENGLERLVDRVLVVDVSEQTQRQRTQARDGVSPTQVEAILAAQLTRAARLARADDVLSNEDGSLPQLEAEILRLHRQYLDLAAGKCGPGNSAPVQKPLH